MFPNCGDSLEDYDYNVDNSGSDNDINEGLDNFTYDNDNDDMIVDDVILVRPVH